MPNGTPAFTQRSHGLRAQFSRDSHALRFRRGSFVPYLLHHFCAGNETGYEPGDRR